MLTAKKGSWWLQTRWACIVKSWITNITIIKLYRSLHINRPTWRLFSFQSKHPGIMLRRAPVCISNMPRKWPSIKNRNMGKKEKKDFLKEKNRANWGLITVAGDDWLFGEAILTGNRRKTDLHAPQRSVMFAEGNRGGGEAVFFFFLR